ncbi:MAG TPA: TrmH family RNA methyltransferase [Candidatus Dormibacteraeota bacterium]|nr:TrmH family RNA methyltransferase [Candidatus Dormibacteraeota bacterium]
MPEIILLAHNLRSSHNVGSLLRTAEGLGVNKVYLTGYTPYPARNGDTRLPHLAQKIERQIHKTALGAQKLIDWQAEANIQQLLTDLRSDGYRLVALEQSAGAIALEDFVVPEKLALIVGREVEGLEKEVLARCDITVEIPMLGQKESFNVVQAAAMALYKIIFS